MYMAKVDKAQRIASELTEYFYPKSFTPSPIYMEKFDQDNPENNVPRCEFKKGDRWGKFDKHAEFTMEVVIPEDYAGQTVQFAVTDGEDGQYTIYINGKITQGIDPYHKEVVITHNAKAGEKYDIRVVGYDPVDKLQDFDCVIRTVHTQVVKLYYHITVPAEVAELLEPNDVRSVEIIKYLTNAVDMLDIRKPHSEAFNKSVDEAIEYLENEFYNGYCKKEKYTVMCVGHTHIDVAWLWRLRQTREKVGRSFSTVLKLMEEYPDYYFSSSQPQLYEFAKEDFPEMYEEIKKRVAEGRWEADGAMWLEADCNITGGESLVRQILFGKRFFNSEFGVDNKVLWLPDVFGYSAALPQILKKSGVDYFCTSKISWNDTNAMPYDSFMWRGIDGTEILTHFLNAKDYNSTHHFATYNAMLNPKHVMGSWQTYKQKDINNESIVSFGYGDGGGGPTREMLEFSTRMEKGIPGCPTVKKGKIIDFFRNLDENMSKAKHVPKWVGELYLEFHRGTYTSMARNKRGNRKNEHLYMDNEFLYSLYKMADKKAEYPVADINAGWKTLLLNQFHDILPGSSIFEVYEDSKADYERIFNKGNELKDKALSGIAGNIGLASDSVVVFNSLGFTRGDIAEFELPEKFRDGFEIIDENGESLAYQFAFNKPNTVVFFAPDIPAKGYKSFALKQAKAEAREGFVYADKTFMSNRYFDVMLDANGNISSIFDKSAKREVLQTGKVANQLIAFEDKPLGYDAWDINVFYQDKAWEINDIRSMEVVESGPVRACIRIVRGFSDSTITNDLYIYNDIPRMDFKTVVDWKEMETMLKVAFPVEIHSDKATYEIQYGNLERNTHWNTSWDYSKFEVCAHKWADLSESGYGVSLLNDCKYGHDIKDSVMRLTLLKSAVFPNPQADKEVHEFTYSIYPHEGDWRDADTVSQAYGLNYPLYAVVEEKHSGAMPETMSLISVDKNNCVIEVVKKAEDSNDLIVRMYECHNRRGKVAVRFAQPLTKVYECDMLENNLNEVDVTDTGFEFELNPYEIKTFKLTVK